MNGDSLKEVETYRVKIVLEVCYNELQTYALGIDECNVSTKAVSLG